jgi:membrane-associated phospholipid phosphatase
MTDYGFPSGHSVGAMLNAFLFLTLAFYLLPASWRWMPYGIYAWMLLICYSRTLLREHAPIQVFAGGTIGITLALIAFLIISSLLKLFFKSATSQAPAQVSAA